MKHNEQPKSAHNAQIKNHSNLKKKYIVKNVMFFLMFLVLNCYEFNNEKRNVCCRT